MNTEGQRWALTQLQEIADASNHQFELLAASEPTEVGQPLEIQVSIDCSGYPKGLASI
jgi:hypothetical protein